MRLVTRADFDGIVCCTLMKQLGIIDSWVFVHPKDIQDKVFKAMSNDILVNVPYSDGCAMWFDHHISEFNRVGYSPNSVKGESRQEKSVARIIYDYYKKSFTFINKGLEKYSDLIDAVDKLDSGKINNDDIHNPSNWVKLGYICDPRSGFGRFREFTINMHELSENLVKWLDTLSIDEIMKSPDIIERIELYNKHSKLFNDMCKSNSVVDNNVLITDLTNTETIYISNRFMVYSLYPDVNVSLWIVRSKRNMISIACGHSVLNKTCKKNIGEIMAKYNGGGLETAGTCQVDYTTYKEVTSNIVRELKDK